MQFKKKDDLKCIYCNESQDFPAIDAIAFIPNFNGYAKPTYDTSVQQHRCCNCNDIFYLKLSGDTVIVENQPSKLYNL